MNKRSNLKWNELSEAGFIKVKRSWAIPAQDYDVTKPRSQTLWPEDSELIAWCDGGPGMNFGGRTILGQDTGKVWVYVD